MYRTELNDVRTVQHDLRIVLVEFSLKESSDAIWSHLSSVSLLKTSVNLFGNISFVHSRDMESEQCGTMCNLNKLNTGSLYAVCTRTPPPSPAPSPPPNKEAQIACRQATRNPREPTGRGSQSHARSETANFLSLL